ncbi:MAG: hypothetical protein H7221_08400, partial [Flavobacterium sp.]|nr:hypothetical protein [Flavobacterium sp.]
MKINITCKKLFFFVLLSLLVSQKSFSQCFQIESILVDACGGADEGKNEMVRFKIGSTAQNISNLVVVWPTNTWQGLIQDANTAAKVLLINQNIDDAGGCGNLLEPIAGILPANAKVILVTSQEFSVNANPFGALSENTYIIFQDNLTTTSGHFANYATSATPLRTLTMNFGSCTDSATYSRILLINQAGNNAAEDGATVNFNAAGNATYTNNGCAAPVLVSTVDAGNATMNGCVGATISLNGTATGQTSVTWSAPSGTFTNPNGLSTNYQIAAPAGSTVVLTLTAYNGLCEITDTIDLTVNPFITPDFATSLTVCNGASAPALINTSPNGINGTWTPAFINNTIGGTYNFAPTAGQCANPTQVVVTIDNSCAFGSFASAVKLKKNINCNNQSEEFYNTSGGGVNLIGPVANEFNNSFLGVYQQNSANLILKGGQVKTFKSTGANLCGVKLKYRIYPLSNVSGTYSVLDFPFYDNCVGGTFPTLGNCVDGDQKWQEIANNLDLTNNLPGNYVVELFYEIKGDNNSTSSCNDTKVLNNGGINFKANFTIQNTPLYSGLNPTECNGNDGSITIAGLSPNTNYSLTYTDNLVVVGPTVYTTASNGNILITNLNAGNYTNFNLNINGCDYSNLIPV